MNAALIVVGWVPKNHPPPSQGAFRENGASKRCVWGQSNINQNRVLRLMSKREKEDGRERESMCAESKWEGGRLRKKGATMNRVFSEPLAAYTSRCSRMCIQLIRVFVKENQVRGLHLPPPFRFS